MKNKGYVDYIFIALICVAVGLTVVMAVLQTSKNISLTNKRATSLHSEFTEFRAPDLVVGKGVASSYEPHIDINRASVTELTKKGYVSAVMARNIVNYREKYGELGAIDELLNIKGIGIKSIEKLNGMYYVK